MLELLNRAGYELNSIGGNIFPCVISKDQKPVGFLLEDGQVALLQEHEDKRPQLEKLAAFSVETEGLEWNQNEGAVLTSYRDYKLVANYDMVKNQPFYTVIQTREDGTARQIQTLLDREAAVDHFLKASELAKKPPQTAQEIHERNVRAFEPERSQPDLPIRDGAVRQELDKIYEIVDHSGRNVGFVRKNGIAVMYGQQGHAQPSLFSTLRDQLAKIGLSLRLHFGLEGRHYAVHDNRHDIAYIQPDLRSISYTSYAAPAHRLQLNGLIQEIRAQAEQAAPVQTRQPAQEQPQQAAPVQTRQPAQEQPQQAAPAQTRQPAQEQPQQAAPAQTRQPAQEQPQQAAPAQTRQPAQEQPQQAAPAQTRQPAVTRPLSPQQRQDNEYMLQAFDTKIAIADTIKGFNPALYDRQMEIIQAIYGTTDREQLERNLKDGTLDLYDLQAMKERGRQEMNWDMLARQANMEIRQPERQKGDAQAHEQ